MIRRFRGRTGRARLLEALRNQTVVGRATGLAEALLPHVSLRDLKNGDTLIRQGASDNDIFFILTGQMKVFVNGREIATREAGQHVGEMALIDPGARRSATVIASENAVVAQLSERSFSAVAEAHPALWRALAVELSRRLTQRARFHSVPRSTPVVFIGSSREGLREARALRRALARDGTVQALLWSEGVFGASRFPLEDLESQLSAADFAILVAGPDDRVRSRGRERDSPRDNVVFELGLFMGALGRRRTFLLVPSGLDLKIPTDLLGLTLLTYNPVRVSRARAISPACLSFLDVVKALGPR